MELKRIDLTLRRWWWLILISGIIAGAASFWVLGKQLPMYSAHTTLVVGTTIRQANPSESQFYLEQQLASIQADIASRDIIKNATMVALGMTKLPNYTASVVPNTPMIEIVVSDTDPKRAQLVANQLAKQLIVYNPATNVAQNNNRGEFINQQLDRLQIQITDTQNQIEKLNQDLGSQESARQIADTRSQITALEEKLTTLQATYAGLLQQTQGGAVNSLAIIEAAELPTLPRANNPYLISALTAIIAFLIAFVAVYLFELFDKTLKTPEEISGLVGLPIIGQITTMPSSRDRWKYVTDHPRAKISDDFRLLRTNLDFFGIDRPLKTLLITSADSSDGKSTIAANLAQILVQSGKKVILMDADFRNPNLHSSLSIPNDYGLSDVLSRQGVKLDDVLFPWDGKNLQVIPVGTIPPNPTELLASEKMSQFMETLKGLADIIVVDGPPFIVPDASVLSKCVDGVMIVASPGFTERSGVLMMKQQLLMTGANVLGLVINRGKSTTSYYNRKYRQYQSAPADKKGLSSPGGLAKVPQEVGEELKGS